MEQTIRQDDSVGCDWMLEEGAEVDQFHVLRPIGRGGMGEVYLARDTQLGRKVALKIIRPDRPLSPEAVQRFLREARATARFNHPHIVTIYGVGELEQRPYVALEYLEGETLRQRLDRRRPSTRELLRIGQAIAEAIREAHAHRILHRDLKPDNVVLAKDGRLRVLDFGVAKALEEEGSVFSATEVVTKFTRAGEAGACAGTPAYMAPEQWQGEVTGGATDIWALGVMLYEALVGHRPYPAADQIPELAAKVCSPTPIEAPDVTDASPELIELVRRCLDKDPDGRPTAVEVVEILTRQLAPLSPGGEVEVCPFQGLLAFTERQCGVFFGREEETGVFIERLRVDPTLAIVGASGAGKSSFVQAGAIPRLREERPLLVVKLRPGHRPFVALARRLLALERPGRQRSQRPAPSQPAPSTVPGSRRASGGLAAHLESSEEGGATGGQAAEVLAAELEQAPGLLAVRLARLAEHRRRPVLLFVDQLEELCTLVALSETRRRFMEAVCNAADDPELPVRAVFTLREEFLSRLAVGRGVREALGRVTVLRTPGPEVLEQIMLSQAASVGYAYDDLDLVRDMVADVLGEHSALSLLQFAGRKLWEGRDRGEAKLRRAVYMEMGGVAGALAQHADGVLMGMTREEAQLARSLLLRLVTHEGTRRVLGLSRLLDGLGERAEGVLARLLDARLVTVRRQQAGGGVLESRLALTSDDESDAEVELAHESLAENWGQLRRWIADSREERQFLGELEQAAALWERRGCRDDEVWQAEALDDALRAAQRCSTGVPGLVLRYLEAGRRRQRRRSLGRRALIGLAFLLLCAIAVGFALKERETREQKEIAESQRAVAEGRRAEANTEGARAALVRGDLLEARAKLRGALEVNDSTDARLLWWRTAAESAIWRRRLGTFIYTLAYAPDGKRIAVGCQDHLVYLLSPETGQVERVLRGHDDQIFTVAFSADGRRLASGAWNGEIWLWDAVAGKGQRLTSHPQGVQALSFSPDGTRLASAGRDGKVVVWDLPSGRRLTSLSGHRAVVYAVAFSPDGERLASGGKDGTVRIWRWRGGGTSLVIRSHTARVNGLSFSPDGALLASAGADQMVRLWDPTSGRGRGVLSGHSAEVFDVVFSRDGRRIVTAGSDQTVRLWSVARRRQLHVFEGHEETVYGVGLSPDGRWIASAGSDRTARLWRIPTGGRVQRRRPGRLVAGAVTGVAFSHDGQLLASGARNGTIHLRDVASGRLVRALVGHRQMVNGLAFSADGRLLVSGSRDRTVRIWDRRSGRQLRVLAGHLATVNGVDLSPDGALIASGSRDASVRVWDRRSGRQLRQLSGHRNGVNGVAFSADGRLLATASADKTVRIWDPLSGRQLHRLDHASEVFGVDFIDAKGRQVVSGGIDGQLRRWTLGEARPQRIGRHRGRVYWLAVDPDGRRVGSPSSDGTARIWSLAGGQPPLVLRGHEGEVNVFAFSPSGALAATTSDDGTVRLWSARTGRPYWRAPALIGSPPRLLSHQGWLRLDRVAATASGEAPPEEGLAGAWREAIKDRGRTVASAAGAPRWICLATFDQRLELWDTRADRALWSRAVPGLGQIVGLPASCLALAGGRVFRYDRAGSRQELVAAKATAIAWDGEAVLAAVGREVRVFSDSGAPRAVLPADLGVTSIARDRHWLALGYRDGNIELYDRQLDYRRQGHAFEEVSASPVKSLRIGQRGTLVGGFADGLLGIWNLRTGKRLGHARLHGALVHLRLAGSTLYAATALGDYRVWRVEALRVDYCALLCDVWRTVPVLWEGGVPVKRGPPARHRCRSKCPGTEGG